MLIMRSLTSCLHGWKLNLLFSLWPRYLETEISRSLNGDHSSVFECYFLYGADLSVPWCMLTLRYVGAQREWLEDMWLFHCVAWVLAHFFYNGWIFCLGLCGGILWPNLGFEEPKQGFEAGCLEHTPYYLHPSSWHLPTTTVSFISWLHNNRIRGACLLPCYLILSLPAVAQVHSMALPLGNAGFHLLGNSHAKMPFFLNDLWKPAARKFIIHAQITNLSFLLFSSDFEWYLDPEPGTFSAKEKRHWTKSLLFLIIFESICAHPWYLIYVFGYLNGEMTNERILESWQMHWCYDQQPFTITASYK
jgi:hypothetical protein